MAEVWQQEAPAEASGPSRDDIWQAATLLIGVYGREAAAYADERRNERQDNGDQVAAETWTLIVAQIEQLLQIAPRSQLH